jgi:hypothetical protein
VADPGARKKTEDMVSREVAILVSVKSHRIGKLLACVYFLNKTPKN